MTKIPTSIEKLDTQYITHYVEKGEKLYDLSKKYKISTEEIRENNK
ncbi:LysM peptidoglycan-binding domain-containing protein [Patescibacteria group bacterium]